MNNIRCSQTNNLEKIRKVIQYLEENGSLEYPGGIPTSLIRSGQQWDFRYVFRGSKIGYTINVTKFSTF